MPSNATRNLALLVAAQTLLFITNATILAVNGVVGREILAAHGLATTLATVPVTAWVLGGALAAYPAALWMRRYGRRNGFCLGALCGLCGTGLALLAVLYSHFTLLCVGSVAVGAYNAFGLQYRFAAADAVSPVQQARAIGLVMSAGLVGGFVGPLISQASRDWLATPYAGVYLALALSMVLALVVVAQLDLAPRAAGEVARPPAQPFWSLLGRREFMIAVAIAALGHGAMSLLMTATTLSMTTHHGHSFDAAAHVLGGHMAAMFAPSLISGVLVQRWREARVLSAGCALYLVAAVIALHGTSVAHFGSAMAVLGVGWNLLFIGSSLLVVRSCAGPLAAYAQGSSEAVVFFTMAFATSAAGVMLDALGWSSLVYAALVATALITGLVGRLARRQQVPASVFRAGS